MSSETPNLPAAAERQQTLEGVPVKWGYDPTSSALTFFSSLASADEAARRLEAQALGSDVPAGSELIGREVLLSNVITHPVELTDTRTGELVAAVRTVLVGPDSLLGAFVALSILKGLRLLSHVYKDPPWNPPLQIRIRQTKGKNGQIWYVFDDLGRPAKGKKGN